MPKYHVSPLIEVPEIAERLGMTDTTVYKLLGAVIPATRVGKRWRINRAEFEAWMAGGQRPASEPTPEPIRLVITPEMLESGREIIIEVKPAKRAVWRVS